MRIQILNLGFKGLNIFTEIEKLSGIKWTRISGFQV